MRGDELRVGWGVGVEKRKVWDLDCVRNELVDSGKKPY